MDFDKALNFHLDEVDLATSEYTVTSPADMISKSTSTLNIANNKVEFNSKVSTNKGVSKILSSKKS